MRFYQTFGTASAKEFEFRSQTSNGILALALAIAWLTSGSSGFWLGCTWFGAPLALICIAIGTIIRAWGTAPDSSAAKGKSKPVASVVDHTSGGGDEDDPDAADSTVSSPPPPLSTNWSGGGGLPASVIYSSSVQTSHLITSGAYSVVRHPIYLGMMFLTTSYGFVLNVWSVVVLIGGGVIRMCRLINREENDLHQKFGTRWSEYCILTPSVIVPKSFDPLWTSMTRHKSWAEWRFGLVQNGAKLFPFVGILVGRLWFTDRAVCASTDGENGDGRWFVTAMILVFIAFDAVSSVRKRIGRKEKQ